MSKKKRKKIQNPLRRRVLRELAGDWTKYTVIFTFLTLMIGAISGMYVANGSMFTALEEGNVKMHLEDGHFIVESPLTEAGIEGIQSGEKADMKQFFLDQAKKELDDKFEEEFQKEFDQEFQKEFDEKYPEEFQKEFDEKFPEEFKKEFDREFSIEFKKEFDAEFPGQFKAGFDAEFPGQFKAGFDAEFPGQFKAGFDAEFPGQFKAGFDAEFPGQFKAGFDAEFPGQFKAGFDVEFSGTFSEQFDAKYKEQLLASLKETDQEALTDEMVEAVWKAAKEGAEYKTAYDTAYHAAYRAAYDEAYQAAYDEAYRSAYTAAYDEAYRSAFSAAYDEAYWSAYSTAYDEAYWPAYSTAYDEAYWSAYSAAYEEAFSTAYDEAYQTAYDEAYQTAYEENFDKKKEESYQEAFDKAYEEAWEEAHDQAYEEAWKEIVEEVNEKYEEAVTDYELDAENFETVPVTVYENFYREGTEDHDLDGVSDGAIRIYKKTDYINQAYILSGRYPEQEQEIAIDRMHAQNAGIKEQDVILVSGVEYKVVGLIAYVNYSTLHEQNTDMVFDALKFNVAMVTEEGFSRLSSEIHYQYSWEYVGTSADEMDEKEEKIRSDFFLKAFITQVVTADNEIVDFLPRYGNQAVNFAPDDIGSDQAMSGVVLYILVAVLAFIFAITISTTIQKESRVIGTLRASGYSKAELVRHYMTMPIVVILVSAVLGNILGYTLFKNAVVTMYYNSYSMPTYETIWNSDAFLSTTIIPAIIMVVVNFVVITRAMSFSPLQFLRHDLKKKKKKKAIRLPKWGFFHRFRLRIMLQNIPNYVILFVGICFVMIMLALAVGLPSTLDFYKKNASEMMFADYQYILKDMKDEDGNVIRTENEDAEGFAITSLNYVTKSFAEEISVYGICDGSQYITLPALAEGEVMISKSFAAKYKLKTGDTITLEEKYENKSFCFQVASIYEDSITMEVFIPIDEFRSIFDLKEDEFTGYLSDSVIEDIEEEHIATVITIRDITKMCDQLDHSMGAFMTYFQIVCILLSAVMVYLLTKIIIEKNENAISMTKILGYRNSEIAMLYILSTTIAVIVSDLFSVMIGKAVMAKAWGIMLERMGGYFEFVIQPLGYLKMILFVLIGYLLVMVFDIARIRRIPMTQALKNVE